MSERATIISQLRDISARCGPARTPEAIRHDIDCLADLLASWERTDFNKGQKVRKCVGDYHVTGTVVAAFTKKSGVIRYVIECDQPAGLLLIFRAEQLEAVT